MKAERPFAVVTGASRGIGAAYARALAVRQYDLLLVSRDKSRLEQLVNELRVAVEVSYDSLDLSESGAGHRLYAAARERRASVDVLVQNAGFGFYGKFADMPMPKVHEMLRLHQSTIVESTRLFLPDMIERRSGAIILVSSIAGFFSVPYLAEYAASKAFQIQFGRALAEEVRPHGVTIQVCCPGTTDTEFHATAGFQSQHPMGSQAPERVVSASLAALGRRTVVTIGWRGRLLALVSRVVPPSWIVQGAARWMKPRDAKSKVIES
jgi:short-subunit dehydrogenase